MPRRGFLSVVVVCSASISMIALAGCTQGGQFDPTEMFSSDIFSTKKKIEGTREPVFPNGVPGAETGVPPDLVKGYQPPPEKAADAAMAEPAAAKPAPEVKPAAEAKRKPKPKVARATPPREAVRDKGKRSTQQTAPPGQSVWPAPPPAGAAQSGQTAWPAPPPTGAAQSGQSIWPAPPPTGASQQAAQPAQPAQSIWPNPPAPGTYQH